MKVPPRVLLSGVFKKHLSSVFRLLQLPCISLKNIHLKCHCALVEQIQNKSSLDGVWKWAKRFRERGTCLYWFAACLSSASSHGSVKWSCKVDAWVIITYQLQSTIILFFLPFFFSGWGVFWGISHSDLLCFSQGESSFIWNSDGLGQEGQSYVQVWLAFVCSSLSHPQLSSIISPMMDSIGLQDVLLSKGISHWDSRHFLCAHCTSCFFFFWFKYII